MAINKEIKTNKKINENEISNIKNFNEKNSEVDELRNSINEIDVNIKVIIKIKSF